MADFLSQLARYVSQELGVDSQSVETCVLCKKSFRESRLTRSGKHEIKVLHCLHSLCGSCLEESLQVNDVVMCPICDATKEQTSSHTNLCNFAMPQGIDRGMVEEQKVIPCDECVESCPAVQYCDQCVRNLCAQCIDHHRRSKATSSHHLASLSELQENVMHRAAFCSEHTEQKLEFYCATCEAMCCRICILRDHETHNYKLPAGGIVETQRQVMQAQIDQMRELATKLQERHAFVTSALRDVDAGLESSLADMEALKSQVKSAIQLRRRELLRQVDAVAASQQAATKQRRAGLTHKMALLWRAIDFVEKVLARGTNVEVLFLSSFITARNKLGGSFFEPSGAHGAGGVAAADEGDCDGPLTWTGDVAEALRRLREMAEVTASASADPGTADVADGDHLALPSGPGRGAFESGGSCGSASSCGGSGDGGGGPLAHSASSRSSGVRAAWGTDPGPQHPRSSEAQQSPEARACPSQQRPRPGVAQRAGDGQDPKAQPPRQAAETHADAAQSAGGDGAPARAAAAVASAATGGAAGAAAIGSRRRDSPKSAGRGGASAAAKAGGPVRRHCAAADGAAPAAATAAGGSGPSARPVGPSSQASTGSAAAATRPPAKALPAPAAESSGQPKRISILDAIEKEVKAPAARQRLQLFEHLNELSPGHFKGVHALSDEELSKTGLRRRAVLGMEGTGPGSFRSPCGMAVDRARIYIADTLNHRIQVFAREGRKLLGQLSLAAAGEGGLQDPSGLCCAGEARLAVVQYGLDRVLSVELEADSLKAIRMQAFAAGHLYGPFGVGFTQGRIVVADSCNHRCLMFSVTGQLLCHFGGRGKGPGQFEYPNCVATFSDGCVAISDKDNNRVEVFSQQGKFLNYIPENWESAAASGEAAGANPLPPGCLRGPMGMVADRRDRLYVCDCGGNRVQIFTRSGRWLWCSDSESAGRSILFRSPTAIAVDDDGQIYVASDHCVQIF